MNYQYGIRRMDYGGYGLFRGQRWSPTWKAKFIRYVLPDLAAKYFAMRNLAPIGSDLHVFKKSLG